MEEYLKICDYFEKNATVSSKLLYGEETYCRDAWITVVIPAYKKEKFLYYALKSVLNQKDIDNYIVLVVDDDPDEKNTKILSMISDIDTGKIVYFKNAQNLGLFGNWNRCMELVKTDWFVMLHDDDFLAERCLETFYNIIFSRKKIDLVALKKSTYYNSQLLDEKDYWKKTQMPVSPELRLRPLKWWSFMSGMRFPFQGSLIRRNFIVHLGGIRLGDYINPKNPEQKSATYAEDYVTMIRMVLAGRAYYLNESLYFTGNGEQQSSSCHVEEWESAFIDQYQCAYKLLQMKKPFGKTWLEKYIGSVLIRNVESVKKGSEKSGRPAYPIQEEKIYQICHVNRTEFTRERMEKLVKRHAVWLKVLSAGSHGKDICIKNQ